MYSTLPLTAWSVIISYAVGGFMLFTLLKIIYRLTLHPLGKYPGPLFSRISSLSIPLQAASGDRHIRQLEEHQKYGPIVRIGPSSLSFASPRALRAIYQSSRAQNPLRKSDYYKTADAPTGAYSTHTEISRKKHAFRRRILDHAFSEASMRSAEGFVLQNLNTFCQVLEYGTKSSSEWSEPREMSKECSYFAYDVMGDLVFGKRFDAMTSTRHRYVPELITSSSWFINFVSHLPLQMIVRPLMCSPRIMNLVGGEDARAGLAFNEYASNCVKARAKEEYGGKIDRKDMMHYILNAKDPETGQPFTEVDLDSESALLIAAGADTTSSTLAAAFFYLTLPSSAAILAHLQSLLRSEFISASQIVWTAIKKHTYLRAVIEETLRLAPSVPSELPRTILQNPGLEIDGVFVPTGTTVGCAAYVLHHDEDIYPDSFSFRPERWVSELSVKTHLSKPSSLQDPEQVARARESFCTFSLGSRGCVGKTLAYMEMCLTIAHVLWTFDPRKAVDIEQPTVRTEEYTRKHGLQWRDDEYQVKDVFIANRAGPLIQFKRVNMAGRYMDDS